MKRREEKGDADGVHIFSLIFSSVTFDGASSDGIYRSSAPAFNVCMSVCMYVCVFVQSVIYT